MRAVLRAITIVTALALLTGPAAAQSAKPLKRCPADSVAAGTVCIDTYEASVWYIPSGGSNASLVRRVKSGKVSLADLVAGQASQVGVVGNVPFPCAANAQDCKDRIFAVSIPGVRPSAFGTWFQAQMACANSGKRLPTNAEWQVAVVGTPDPGPDDGTNDCNSDSVDNVVETGSRGACVSAWGAHDMVGNVMEWVVDWMPRSTTCTGWGTFSDDYMCMAGASTSAPGPSALARGGGYYQISNGVQAGPLTVWALDPPTTVTSTVGFRCVR